MGDRTVMLGKGDKQRRLTLRVPSLDEIHPAMRAQVQKAASHIAKLEDRDQIEARLAEVQASAFRAAIAADPDDGLDAALYGAQVCVLTGDLAGEIALRDAPPRGRA